MRVYKVPFNFKHEEKIFGGYLSLRQAIYLIIAIAGAGILFIPFIPMAIKATVFLINLIIFILFAFLKIEETSTDKYFINILKYMLRQKIYMYER